MKYAVWEKRKNKKNPRRSSGSVYSAAVALGADGRYYVLEDCSCRGSPLEWAKRVIALYHKLDADRVVGEVNNGGELIEALLNQFDPTVSFKPVYASRGKAARAEPVAALYEKGMVSHVGIFRDLEDEMTSFDPLMQTKSPYRMDALVWAVAELTQPQERFFLA